MFGDRYSETDVFMCERAEAIPSEHKTIYEVWKRTQ